MAGESIGSSRRPVGTAAVVLAAVVAFSCLAAGHAQPLHPWNPQHHVRDAHHSDADGRFMMVDLDDGGRGSVPVEDRPEPIPGVVLWSMSCTGSEAYAQTLLDWSRNSNLSLAPLCGKSEYFFEEAPSRDLIYRCLKEHPEGQGFFTHIHPGNIKSDTDLSSPYDVLRVLKEQGATVLLVVQRENWLARYVSSAEVVMSHHAKTRVHGTSKRMQAFYDYFRSFSGQPVSPEFLRKMSNNAQKAIKGYDAGKSLGYRIVKSSYSRTSWPCPQVTEALEAMAEEGVVKEAPADGCVAVTNPSNAPRRGMELKDRVGPQAAKLLQDNLEGSKYEWMLDLYREDPPEEAITSQASRGWQPPSQLRRISRRSL